MRLVDAYGNDLFIPGTSNLAQYPLPAGAIVNLADGAEVAVGDIIARIPQESSRLATSPAVCHEWPTCSKPANREQAILAEKSGIIEFGKEPRASSDW